jgi:hypothetical protein
MSAITREVIFSDKDKNHHVVVSGKEIEIKINNVFSGFIDVNDADLLINILREAINEIVGAAQ